MKPRCIYFLAVLFLGGSIAWQSVQGTEPQRQEYGHSLSQPIAQLSLRRAKTSWPKFLREFRSALQKRDRNALFSMSSEKLEKNCLVEDGRDIRQEFFADDGNLHHYLKIVTPGRHGNFVSKIVPVRYDKEAGVVRTWAEMNPCAWSLSFEYRENSGWLLVHYGLTCEGC